MLSFIYNLKLKNFPKSSVSIVSKAGYQVVIGFFCFQKKCLKPQINRDLVDLLGGITI